MRKAMVSSIVAALLGGAPLCAAPSLVSVPLTFEPGLRKSEFIARSGGLGAHLSPTAAVIGPGRMRLIGANRTASAQAEELLPGYSNYLVGKDSRSWRTHVPNYRRIRYHNVYPGIDVVYYGNPRELEFDFVVAPGADPRRIQLAVDDPNLQVRLPRIYQSDRNVRGRAVRRGNRISFEMAAYDRSRPW